MDFIQFPKFSGENLAVWFVQVESVLALNGLETDSEKYHYVIAHLPLEFATLVEDVILNPPSENKYQHFKNKFIKRMTLNRLKKEQLGDEKPSEYLKRLKKIGDHRVSQEVILNTWIKKLPTQVREVVSLETSRNLDTVGLMADKVISLLPPTTPQRNELAPSQLIEFLTYRINDMANKIKGLQLMFDGEVGTEQFNCATNKL